MLIFYKELVCHLSACCWLAILVLSSSDYRIILERLKQWINKLSLGLIRLALRAVVFWHFGTYNYEIPYKPNYFLLFVSDVMVSSHWLTYMCGIVFYFSTGSITFLFLMAVCWFIVAVCMVDIIMLSSGQHCQINGMLSLQNIFFLSVSTFWTSPAGSQSSREKFCIMSYRHTEKVHQLTLWFDLWLNVIIWFYVRYKFDDERVTKEDNKRALEEQYGGEEEV